MPLQPVAAAQASASIGTKQIIGGLIAIAVAAGAYGVAKTLTESSVSVNTGSAHDVNLQEISAEINADLPVMVEDGVRWDSVSASGNTFVYTYTITKYQKEDIDIVKLRSILAENIANNLCTDPDIKVLFDNAIDLQFRVFDLDGDFLMSSSVDAGACS